MRRSGWVWTSALFSAVAGAGGCVSLDDHNRLKAANRTLTAEKEALGQELFDERHVNDTLRTKIEALSSELATKQELLANLRGENELLDEYRRTALNALEEYQKRQALGDVPILPPALDTALRKLAEDYPNDVVYDPIHGTVKWKADLLFPLGSDEVKPASAESLKSFTEILKSPAAADFEVVVVGHTDTRPIQRPQTREKHPTNWHLSTHRAIAVGNVLQRHGYRPDRIGCMGCGEYRPIADNSSEAGSAQNRRVEIYIVPVGTIASAPSSIAATSGGRSGKPSAKEAKGTVRGQPAKSAAVKETPAPRKEKPESDIPEEP